MFRNIYAGKRVLVTGHTGFKGSWLSLWLARLEAKVCGFSVNIPSRPSFFDALSLDQRLIDCRGDIRDFAQIKKVFDDFKPEIVFHLAAQSLVKDGHLYPKETFDVNAGGTVNILECIRQTPQCRTAVMVTSDKVYALSDKHLQETDRLGSEDPYSGSKSAAEMACAAYIKTYFKNGHAAVAVARAGNVIGGGDWADGRLVPDCVRAWSQSKKARIRNPKAVRPWQYVLDLLSGYLKLGEKLSFGDSAVVGEAFNFGPKEMRPFSVGELVGLLSDKWPQSEWYVEGEQNEKPDHSMLLLDSEKASRILHWRPKLTVEQMLEFTVHWYRLFGEKPNELPYFTKAQFVGFERS